jgi:hypothetical protein
VAAAATPPNSTAPESRAKSWKMSLPGIEPSWSFKNSWASNLTMAGAVFTDRFGVK